VHDDVELAYVTVMILKSRKAYLDDDSDLSDNPIIYPDERSRARNPLLNLFNLIYPHKDLASHVASPP